MYEYLEGRLSMRAAARLVLDVHGVGYALSVPLGVAFPDTNPLRVYVHQVVREDAHTLYGFPDEKTRNLFRTLLLVRGVGPAMALGILSSLPGQTLIDAIVSNDHARLCSVKGVGKKTAEQILLDLRDKIAVFGLHTSATPLPTTTLTPERQDAVAALVSIGYKERDAEKAVNKAADRVGESDLNELIRAALSLG